MHSLGLVSWRRHPLAPFESSAQNLRLNSNTQRVIWRGHAVCQSNTHSLFSLFRSFDLAFLFFLFLFVLFISSLRLIAKLLGSFSNFDRQNVERALLRLRPGLCFGLGPASTASRSFAKIFSGRCFLQLVGGFLAKLYLCLSSSSTLRLARMNSVEPFSYKFNDSNALLHIAVRLQAACGPTRRNVQRAPFSFQAICTKHSDHLGSLAFWLPPEHDSMSAFFQIIKHSGLSVLQETETNRWLWHTQHVITRRLALKNRNANFK